MPITFNSLLQEHGVSPKDVRLLRHKDPWATKGRSPYELWRDNLPDFDRYQCIQSFGNRSKLSAAYWAAFVVNLDEETLFVGLYAVKKQSVLKEDFPRPHMDGFEKAGSRDIYDLKLQDSLRNLAGRLFIEWGPGTRSWIQRAERKNKEITKLDKEFREPTFPGFLNFRKQLSMLNKLPQSWIGALQSSRGIYLLTCPKTKEQYVGAANGENGFWGRWQYYIESGHGGNIGLKSRDPSDYQVSILEVAGTAASAEEITAMEILWKSKLQSQEMGLNRN